MKRKALVPVAGCSALWALASTGVGIESDQLTWVAVKVSTPSFYTDLESTGRDKITKITALRTAISAELDWLGEFYSKHSQASKAEEIFPLVKGVGEMFQKRQYGLVDRILNEAELDALSPTVMITLVRTTYPARKKLNKWSSAVGAVKDQLDSQGLDSKRLLRGLV